MKWETSDISSSNWLLGDTRTTKWTATENKMFENALAVFDKDSPDRWHKVAAMIPGKTVVDVIKQYKELEADISNIEAGLIPLPGYSNSSHFTLEWVSNHSYDGFKHPCVVGGKRSSSVSPAEHERKKGVPWTEEEHKLFLLGLKKHGKGDWRNISRNFVTSRTPTQVASHAQKYFIRQLSGGKDKKRASIHDITTVNLKETRTPPSPDTQGTPSPDQDTSVQSQQQQPNYGGALPGANFQWHQPNYGATAAFSSTQGNMFMTYPDVNDSYGIEMPGQNLQIDAIHEPYLGLQNMAFQMQYSQGQSMAAAASSHV